MKSKRSSKRKSRRKVGGIAVRRKGKREEIQKKTGRFASKSQIYRDGILERNF
jgi:hypothetical protein